MKLYEFLQQGLSTTEIYQALISMEEAPNVLLAGNFDLLPTYTPEDVNGEIRRSFLRKIMARYYNYELFTEDSLYFASRLFWRLTQIMPTYAAKFNASITLEEFQVVFRSTLTESVIRDTTGSDTSESNSSGKGSSKTNQSTTGSQTRNNTGSQNTEGSSSQESETVNFNSDYPQVVVGVSTDYNTSGGKATSNGKTSNTGKQTESSTEELTDNQIMDGETSSTDERTDNRTGTSKENVVETRSRQLRPDELLLAKEKIFKLVMNIEEEITNAVSDMFNNVGWLDEDDYAFNQKWKQTNREVLAFAVQLNTLTERINTLDFTEEEIGYIGEVPSLKEAVSSLQAEAAQLRIDIDGINANILPDVTSADADKILMVDDTGNWGAQLLPNWATEGF